jgi:hypothetical protein
LLINAKSLSELQNIRARESEKQQIAELLTIPTGPNGWRSVMFVLLQIYPPEAAAEDGSTAAAAST